MSSKVIKYIYKSDSESVSFPRLDEPETCPDNALSLRRLDRIGVVIVDVNEWLWEPIERLVADAIMEFDTLVLAMQE